MAAELHHAIDVGDTSPEGLARRVARLERLLGLVALFDAAALLFARCWSTDRRAVWPELKAMLEEIQAIGRAAKEHAAVRGEGGANG